MKQEKCKGGLTYEYIFNGSLPNYKLHTKLDICRTLHVLRKLFG